MRFSLAQIPHSNAKHKHIQSDEGVLSRIFRKKEEPKPHAKPLTGSRPTATYAMFAMEGFQPLSKEERTEAARIAMEAQFSFDGYQVVRREFFSHKFDPTLTIRGSSIIFNNACISKLDQVVYVQVLINPADEKLVMAAAFSLSNLFVALSVQSEKERVAALESR